MNYKLYYISVMFIVLSFRCMTDIMDGYCARKYNKVTRLGGYLDTINDNIMFGFSTYALI